MTFKASQFLQLPHCCRPNEDMKQPFDQSVLSKLLEGYKFSFEAIDDMISEENSMVISLNLQIFELQHVQAKHHLKLKKYAYCRRYLKDQNEK